MNTIIHPSDPFFEDLTGDPTISQRDDTPSAGMDLEDGESPPQSPHPPPQHPQHPQHGAPSDKRKRSTPPPESIQAAPPTKPLDPKYGPWQYGSVAEIKARRVVIERELKMLSEREKLLKREERERDGVKVHRREKKKKRYQREVMRQGTEERYAEWEWEYREWEERFGGAAGKEDGANE